MPPFRNYSLKEFPTLFSHLLYHIHFSLSIKNQFIIHKKRTISMLWLSKCLWFYVGRLFPEDVLHEDAGLAVHACLVLTRKLRIGKRPQPQAFLSGFANPLVCGHFPFLLHLLTANIFNAH